MNKSLELRLSMKEEKICNLFHEDSLLKASLEILSVESS